jgi:hypothetical protein
VILVEGAHALEAATAIAADDSGGVVHDEEFDGG